MLSPLQSAFTEHFLHRDRLIKVELLGESLLVIDNYSTCQIQLNFSTYFSTEQDNYGNLVSISIFGERVVHLAHSNPTVLDQWVELLHKNIHKVGFHKDYILLEKIGEGASATVYIGKDERNGSKVAIKAFSKSKMQKKDWMAVQNEIFILKVIDSHYFPRLLGTYVTEKSIYLVMEYVPGLDLKELNDKKSTDLHEKKRILREIGLALNVLHQRQVIHRDIKPENIIVNSTTRQIKIIDFGFAVYLPDRAKAYSNCGTPGYAAPQTFKKDYEPGSENDVFSLGVLAHFIFTSKLPFKQRGRSILLDSRDCQFAFSSELTKFPSALTTIRQMVCPQSKRISLHEFLNSNLFLNSQSLCNPEARPQSKKMENLSILNDKAYSLCARERCCSIKVKNSSIRPLHDRISKRLVTDRF